MRSNLADLVSAYRKEVAGVGEARRAAPGLELELEIRFPDLSYELFAAVFAALQARGGGRLRRLITVHEGGVGENRRQPGPGGRAGSAGRIREIEFVGAGEKRERCLVKRQVVPPYRAGGEPPYTVALSTERPEACGFAADGGSVVRVKPRACFPLSVPREGGGAFLWRVDASVVRQLAGGSAAEALRQVVDQMVRPQRTPAELLEALGLAEGKAADVAAARALYRFELEAELEGPEAERDLLRPADIEAAAAALVALAGDAPRAAAALQAAVHRVARHIEMAPARLRSFEHGLGLKQLLPQVHALTRSEYRRLYPPKELYLTAKADGQRAVAIAQDGRALLVTAEALRAFESPEATPAREGETVVDGELVVAEGKAVFYAFDVIAVAGESVAAEGFDRRLEHLAEAVGRLVAAGAPARAKHFARLSGESPAALEREIRGVLEEPQAFAADGLIFVEPGRPYAETRSYKWKSKHDTTIDSVARRAPAGALGAPPFADRPGHRLHFLFVSIDEGLYAALGLQPCPGYAELFGPRVERGRRAGPRQRAEGRSSAGALFPTPFAPCDAPLAYLYQHPEDSPFGEIDGKVVEVRRLDAQGRDSKEPPAISWELVRLRTDRQAGYDAGRYFGNSFRVAELTWLNYVDPFPLEDLWARPGADYFAQPKSGTYRAQTAAISYMKGRRIGQLRGAAWVVDLGAGKGQDLGRYRAAGVGHLVAIDQSRAALSELVRRHYDLSAGRRDKKASEPLAGRMRLTTLEADATQPAAALRERLGRLGLPAEGADALVCNLALHYFLGTPAGLRNFAELARLVVRPGGTLSLTILRGAAVHAAFIAAGLRPGSAWEAREGGRIKYSLQRRYAGAELEAAGQMIGVLLPFSDGEHYEEPLVNAQELTRALRDAGFALREETKATDFLADFARERPELVAMLTPADREYLGFYGELIYTRPEAPTGGTGRAGAARRVPARRAEKPAKQKTSASPGAGAGPLSTAPPGQFDTSKR